MSKKTSLLHLLDGIYAAEKRGLIRDIHFIRAGINLQYVRFMTFTPIAAETARKLTHYLETECEAVREASISKYDIVILYTPSVP